MEQKSYDFKSRPVAWIGYRLAEVHYADCASFPRESKVYQSASNEVGRAGDVQELAVSGEGRASGTLKIHALTAYVRPRTALGTHENPREIAQLVEYRLIATTDSQP